MITFDEQKHEYTLDGKKLISVTQLMQKHGLAPNYAGVSTEVLEKKAERGSLIHAEIEDFIKNGEIGFTEELAQFRDYISKTKIASIESEKIVHNDLVAGTLDLLFIEDDIQTIADIKTTATLHKEAVSWQLSIYNYLNGWTAEKGQAFHFNNEGVLKVVDIPFKPKEEVEKLMQAERNGEQYQLPQIVIDTNQLAIIEEATKIIAEADHMKKEAEIRMNEVKEAILKAMEKNSVKSFENDSLKITYVAPVTKTTLDSARLKKELPDVAEKYSKTSEQKASIRITVKVETRPQVNGDCETR